MQAPAITRAASVRTAKPGKLTANIIFLSWVAFCAVSLASLLGLRLPETWLVAPLVASILVLGLPHGAADHIVLLRQRGLPFSWFAVARVIVPYVALAIAYLALWLAAAELAFLLFIVLTWVHWGQGDVHSLNAFTGATHLRTRASRILALVVRGGLPMLVPLLFFPDVYTDVAGWVINTIEPDGSIAWITDATFRSTIGFGFLALSAYYFLTSFPRERMSPAGPGARVSWNRDLTEFLVLALFFATVHPLLAIGLYFCLWHSARHILRVVSTHYGGNHPAQLRISSQQVRRFAFYALPTTVVAILALAALYVLVPPGAQLATASDPSVASTFVGRYLLLISILTLPHVWVVFRMDKSEGIWKGKLSN